MKRVVNSCVFLVLVCGVIFHSGVPALRAEGPNVMLIVVKDLGGSDLGCYGSKFHQTPALDRLAERGVRFTQAYSAASGGMGAEYGLMNGMSPARLPMAGSISPDRDLKRDKLLPPMTSQRLPISTQSLAEILRKQEYRTVLVEGEMSPVPEIQGFDERKPIPKSSATDPTGAVLEGAEKVLAAHSGKKLFIYVPIDPFQKPLKGDAGKVAKYVSLKATGLQRNADYAARLESLDENIGRLVRKLEELKLLEKTVVVVTSTGGGNATGDGKGPPPTNNGPYREGKGYLYEGGIRVPLIFAGAGIPKRNVCARPVIGMDVCATLVELCGAQISQETDGASFLGALQGKAIAPAGALYWHTPVYTPEGGRPCGAMREGDYKLLEFYETGRQELFKVGTEPNEGTNLSDKAPGRVAEMGAKLKAWRTSVGAVMPVLNREYRPTGPEPDGSIVLPAREADVEGVMLRYEPLPHKNTLGYWVRADDWAHWMFQVTEPGKYQVKILQGCGNGSGGSRVEFRVGEESVTTTVEETGGFQEFRWREIGTLEINKAGRHTLTVKALTKPGVAVMDLREVRLVPIR